MNNSTTDSFIDNRVESEINFKEVLQRYLRYWRWFILSLIVFLAIGYIYAKMQVPEYKVDIALLIKDKDQNNDKDLLQQLNLFSSEKIIDNEIQVLKTGMLMEKVIESLDLQNTYMVEKSFSQSILYGNDIPFKINLLKPSNELGAKKWIGKLNSKNELEFDGKVIPFNHPYKLGQVY